MQKKETKAQTLHRHFEPAPKPQMGVGGLSISGTAIYLKSNDNRAGSIYLKTMVGGTRAWGTIWTFSARVWQIGEDVANYVKFGSTRPKYEELPE